MKKKILLGVIMILSLACLFAISISAEEIDGVHYTLNTNSQTATVSTGNRTATTQIVTIPSTIEYNGVEYKVTSIANDAFYGNKNVVELRILSEHITKIPAAMIADTYSSGALKKIYIDFSNITSIGSAAFNPSNQTNGNSPQKNSFYYYDAKAFLKSGEDVLITCPDFSNCTSIGTAAFQGANFEKLVIPEAVYMNNQIFRLSTIKELVIEGESREKIEYYVFQACQSLEKITIESRNLKSISNDVFSNCVNVKEIHMDLSKCTSVGASAFQFSKKYDEGNTTTQWYSLEGEKIVDLTSMKTFSERAFASSNIGSAKIVWPVAIESYNSQVFRKCNISQPIYINAAEGKTLNIEYWSFDGNKFPVVVLGKGVTKFSARLSQQCVVVSLAESIEFADNTVFSQSSGNTLYCKAYTGTDISNKATVNIITGGSVSTYGACGLVANVTLTDGTKQDFNYVNHEYTGVADETVCPSGSLILYTCAGCKDTYEETTDAFVSKEHNFDLENGASVAEIIYINNNYFANGIVKIKCAGCDASNEDTEIGALFTAVGYSQNEISGGFISHTMKVNLDNIAEYERLTGITVRYGLVASMHKDGKPIYLNGDEIIAVDKAISLEMTNTEYTNLLIKINGITDERAINCNAYAVINGEITYLCGDTASDTATAKSLSIVPEVAESISCEAQAPESKQYA